MNVGNVVHCISITEYALMHTLILLIVDTEILSSSNVIYFNCAYKCSCSTHFNIVVWRTAITELKVSGI